MQLALIKNKIGKYIFEYDTVDHFKSCSVWCQKDFQRGITGYITLNCCHCCKAVTLSRGEIGIKQLIISIDNFVRLYWS